MKKNIILVMDKLDIDNRIRNLIRQLWKHCYKTSNSCEGHGSEAYIMFTGGNGWFEENAFKYSLAKVKNKDCCPREFQDEIRKYGLDPKNFVDKRKTCGCGAGINSNSVYRGKLIQNHFLKNLKIPRNLSEAPNRSRAAGHLI